MNALTQLCRRTAEPSLKSASRFHESAQRLRFFMIPIISSLETTEIAALFFIQAVFHKLPISFN
jgi:hypothetical protein